MLIDTYELQLEKGRRKEIGAYYTPVSIIDYMLDKTVAKADLLSNPFLRVLDPACGCGYFLLRTYELLYLMFSEQLGNLRRQHGQEVYVCVKNGQVHYLRGEEYWQAEHLPYHIISHCLYGVDIDGQAAALAAGALAGKAGSSTTVTPRIVVADSLAKWEYTGQTLWTQTYDYIIGNPPYISYGLRGVKALESDRYKQLTKAYPGSAEYKLSIYALFFERGVELLKSGGQLAYITPDSFLAGRYFSRLRSLLMQYEINSITLLEFTVFEDAAIGKGVITVLSKKPNLENELCVEAAATEQQLATGQLNKRFTYKQQYLNRQFSLFFNQEELEVYHAMQELKKQLADCCSLYSGCIARFGQKSVISSKPVQHHIIQDYQGNVIIDDRQAESRWQKLLVKGANIQQYQVQSEGHYIYIHEDERVRRSYAKSGFDLEKYAKEKLFLRQTGEKLVAAYDNMGYYCLNNMHILYSIDECIPVKLLLALLNSRLYNYYYQCITREAGRVLPQVDIDTVKRMPFLEVSNTQVLVTLAEELMACYAECHGAETIAAAKRLQDIRHTLEKAIMDNLDIRPSTKQLILAD